MSEETKNKSDEIELCYGMLDGEIVHISEVESGIQQNCLCAKCGSILIAKKGDIRKHHFAHYNYENCQGAQETALHLLAKEILYLNKCISLPIPNSTEQTIKAFDQVRLEVRELGLIYDAIGYSESDKLAIEIKVSHAIDDRKRQIVLDHNIQMIEIDLSAFISGEKNRDEITDAVIHSAPRFWINELTTQEPKTEKKDMINKAKIAGFKLASGYSHKNSCNFESNKIFILQPIDNKSSANYRISASGGYEILQLDIVEKTELIEKLSGFTFPVDVTLTVETAFQRNKCRPVVTDVNLI